MTLAEEMAVAVLKGDVAAAQALADRLLNDIQRTEMILPPVKQITCSLDRLRIVVRTYKELEGDVLVDEPFLQQRINQWLRGETHLVLIGMEVEMYELPEVSLVERVHVRLPPSQNV